MTDSPEQIEILDPETHAYLFDSDGEPPLSIVSQPSQTRCYSQTLKEKNSQQGYRNASNLIKIPEEAGSELSEIGKFNTQTQLRKYGQEEIKKAEEASYNYLSQNRENSGPGVFALFSQPITPPRPLLAPKKGLSYEELNAKFEEYEKIQRDKRKSKLWKQPDFPLDWRCKIVRVPGQKRINMDSLGRGQVILRPEPHNPADRNAIQVWFLEQATEQEFNCGYIPRELAQSLVLILAHSQPGNVPQEPSLSLYSQKHHPLDLEVKYLHIDRELSFSLNLRCQKEVYDSLVPKRVLRGVFEIWKYSRKNCEESQRVAQALEEVALFQSQASLLEEEKEKAEVRREEEKNFKYMRNLKLVLETVQYYSHLFTDKEMELIAQYLELQERSQTILVKILTRKRVWFSKNHFAGLELSESHFTDLQLAGFVKPLTALLEEKEKGKDLDQADDLFEFLEEMKVDQLKAVKTSLAKIKNNVLNPFETHQTVLPLELSSKNPFYRLHADPETENQDFLEAHYDNELQSVIKQCSQLITSYLHQKRSKQKAGTKKKMRGGLGGGKQEDTKQVLTASVFSTIMKMLKWDDALNQLTSTQSQTKGNASLLSFFKPISKAKKETYSPQEMGAKIGKVILGALEGVMLYRMEGWVRSLFVKCLRLFFFFQESDIFGTLILHDYGMVYFQKYTNYVDQVKSQKIHQDCLPLFLGREEFLSYHNIYSVGEAFWIFSELRFKERELEFEVAWTLAKGVLSLYFFEESMQARNMLPHDKALDFYLAGQDAYSMLQGFNQIFPVIQSQFQQRIAPLRRRFTSKEKGAGILVHCVYYLERMQEYGKACYVLMSLLLALSYKKSKRPHCWYRLLVNVTSHLKVKNSELVAQTAQLALAEAPPAGMRNKIMKYVKREKEQGKKKKENMKRAKTAEDLPAQFFVQFDTLELKKRGEEAQDWPIDWNICKNVYLKAKQTRVEDGFFYKDKEGGLYAYVEDLAMKYYQREQSCRTLHIENALMRHLLGLFLWKEIFDDTVPFVFQTPYQSAPLDLYYDSLFYEARKQKIDSRLHKIAKMGGAQREKEIQEIYVAKRGLKNPLIDWDSRKLTKEVLSSIAGLMDGRVLREVLLRLVGDIKTWSHGWPDLVCWNVKEKVVKFVEVKSQTDRLSEQQKCWLSVLSGLGQQVEVLYVRDEEGFDILN